MQPRRMRFNHKAFIIDITRPKYDLSMLLHGNTDQFPANVLVFLDAYALCGNLLVVRRDT